MENVDVTIEEKVINIEAKEKVVNVTVDGGRGPRGLPAPSTNQLYFNSYVDRLRALGSNIIASNYDGAGLSTLQFVNGYVYLMSIYISSRITLNGFGYTMGIGGDYTAFDYNGIGIYSFDKDTKIYTLIASTENDTEMWKSPLLHYVTKDLAEPIILESGIYFIAYLHNRSSAVTSPAIHTSSTQVITANIFPNMLPSNVFLNCALYVVSPTFPETILHTETTGGISSINSFLY